MSVSVFDGKLQVSVNDDGSVKVATPDNKYTVTLSAHTEGVQIANNSKDSCEYVHKDKRHVFLFSDAQPKCCWDKYDLLHIER